MILGVGAPAILNAQRVLKLVPRVSGIFKVSFHQLVIVIFCLEETRKLKKQTGCPRYERCDMLLEETFMNCIQEIFAGLEKETFKFTN